MSAEHSPRYYGWVADQHHQAIVALSALELASDSVPTHQDILESTSPATSTWLDQRADNGIQDELVITLNARAFGSMGMLIDVGSIEHYEKAYPPPSPELKIHPDVYDVLGVQKRSPLHSHDRPSRFSAAVSLQDRYNPQHIQEPVNTLGKPGLVFTNMTIEGQRAALAAERLDHLRHGRDIIPATIGHIMMANTIRHITYQPLLDEFNSTSTRLTTYKTITHGWLDMIPVIHANQGYPVLTLQDTAEDETTGVRRLLQLPLAV